MTSYDVLAMHGQPPQKQMRRAGKPRRLDSKDLVKAFCRPDETKVCLVGNGCYVFVTTTTESHDDITLFLIASERREAIKQAIDSIFLAGESPAPVEIDQELREYADGIFAGSWHVFEAEGLSFTFLAS
ncbi:MAG: hypothetical protein WAW33_03155, partial [Minisyncoccia bacterium]